MHMVIKYQELAKVQLMHAYHLHGSLPAADEGNEFSKWLDVPYENLEPFARKVLEEEYDIHKDIQISPTADTKQVMEFHKILFRSYAKGFFLSCRTEKKGVEGGLAISAYEVPYVPFDQAFVLRFTIEVRNPEFMNFTNLRTRTSPTGIYHFSNKAQTLSGHTTALPLSRSIAAFSSDERYDAGDLVTNLGDDLFEALQNTQGNGLESLSHWRKIRPKPYMSHADWVSVFPESFSVDFQAIAKAQLSQVYTIEWTLRDENNQALEGETNFIFRTGNPVADPILQGDMDVRRLRLRPGMYTYSLTFKDQGGNAISGLSRSEVIYLDNDAYSRRMWGIIELHYDPNNSLGSYDLLDRESFPESSLKKNIFTIWLKNRSTKWRYRSMPTINMLNGGNGNNGAPFQEWMGETEELVPLTRSNRHMGLTHTGSGLAIETHPDFESGNLLQTLPNPGVRNIISEENTWFSEVLFHKKPNINA